MTVIRQTKTENKTSNPERTELQFSRVHARVGGGFMFDSLDDTMKRDENEQSTSRERMLRYVMYGAISVIVFGGLIFGVHALS